MITGTLLFKEIEFTFVLEQEELHLIPPKEKHNTIEFEWKWKKIGPDGPYVPADPIYVTESQLVGKCNETGGKIVFLPKQGADLGFHNHIVIIELVAYAALELIEVARAYQEKHSGKGEYIFSMTKDALSYAETNILLKKYCKRLDILYRSSHKLRKTYISSLIDAGININTIRSYAGHADEKTTYFNYCFDRATDAEKKTLLERALAN